MKIYSLFTTEVYQKSLYSGARWGHQKKSQFLKDLKQECYQIQAHDHLGQEWSAKNYPGGYTCYASIPRVNELSSSFEDLKKVLDKHVLQFAKTLQYDVNAKSIYLNSLWINIMPSQVVHTGHIHPQSFISGTFYVDVPPAASAIRFEDPRLGFFMNAPLQKTAALKDSRKRFFSVTPKPGDVVLFESWLRHEVPPNQASKDRISISFNYSWG